MKTKRVVLNIVVLRVADVRVINSTTVVYYLHELSKFLLLNQCDVDRIKTVVYDTLDQMKKQTKITDYFT